MARRRADAAPGLLDRVRWGNVGRLAALLAAGLLIATGPRGCGAPDAEPQGTPPPLAQAPPAEPQPTSPQGAARTKTRRPARPQHRKHRKHRKTRGRRPARAFSGGNPLAPIPTPAPRAHARIWAPALHAANPGGEFGP